MSDTQALNVSSLKMVHPELVVTIEQATEQLEQYIAQAEDSVLLQDFVASMTQVNGTLNLIQLKGVDKLAQEIVALARHIDDAEANKSDEGHLSLLARSIFILPRYLEYLLHTQSQMPVLLVGHINELRKARKAAPIYDSHFLQVDFSQGLVFKGPSPEDLNAEELPSLVKRLRHMFQVGLLGILQNRQLKPSLSMIQRALLRMSILQGHSSQYALWCLSAQALDLLKSCSMDLSLSRKRLLSALDRAFKRAVKGLESEEGTDVSEGLLRELLYIIALSGDKSDKSLRFLAQYGLSALPYTDRDIRKESEALQGPSSDTMQSMAMVLIDELKSAKGILERASEGGINQSEDLTLLNETLSKIAEILNVVGLVVPAASLKEEIAKTQMWERRKALGSDQEQMDLADVLLYVESAVNGMGSLNLSDNKLSKANNQERQEVMAQSQINEAMQIVITESEAGLSLVKRALSSFTESNFDRAHIQNVTVSLTAIRGVMSMLSLPRAEAVVYASIEFVESTLLDGSAQPALDQLMETFADAVISIEYYLDGIKNDLGASDKVLEIAEESLAALGYPVEDIE